MNFDAWMLENGHYDSPANIQKNCSVSPDVMNEILDYQLNHFPGSTVNDVIWFYFRRLYLQYYLSTPFKVDINKYVERGHTPLMMAVQNGALEEARQILQYEEVDLNMRSNDELGNTVAHLALATDNDNAFLILSMLANVPEIDWNIVDSKQRSPLEYAVGFEKVTEIQYLLEATNMDPNAPTSYGGNTTLMTIFCGSDEELKIKKLKIFQQLTNINWNAKNELGHSLSFFAADDSIGEKVLDILASVPSIDWNRKLKGKCPLLMALQEENFTFLRFLFKLPHIRYDVADLFVFGNGIKTSTLMKCIDICKGDQKKNGYNYSDVIDFLNDAVQIRIQNTRDSIDFRFI